MITNSAQWLSLNDLVNTNSRSRRRAHTIVVRHQGQQSQQGRIDDIYFEMMAECRVMRRQLDRLLSRLQELREPYEL